MKQPHPIHPSEPDRASKSRHVVFATDDRGFLPLMVAVRSLLKSADKAFPLRVSILTGCGALTREHEAALLGLAEGDEASLEVINCDDLMTRYRNVIGKENGVWGSMMWARCFIAECFPEAHGNIVYLDIDTFVCCDLAELYNLDLTGMVLAAVPETRRDARENPDPIWESDIMSSQATAYFNSGVLVMNVDAFREERLLPQIMDWYGVHRDAVTRPDQDALNCLFWARTVWLPARYNHCDGWLDRQFKQSANDAHWRGCPPREILEAILNPAILHYWGPKKPWKWNHRPEGRRYERCLRELGLVEGRLPGTTPVRRIVGGFYEAYHAIARRIAAARLSRLSSIRR